MELDVWSDIRVDVLSFVACAAMMAAYHYFIVFRVRANPAYTLQSVVILARAAWVKSCMGEKRDILAVQTLRNSIMGAVFMASTAVLLIIGVLTLSGQSDKLGATWHAWNTVGTTRAELWLAKLMVLLSDLLVAFFSFALAIRYFNHVGYMVNVPLAMGYDAISPDRVAAELNRAGKCYGIGMRLYYLMVPLVMWLFGPHLMVAATAVVLYVLYRTDRMPKNLSATPQPVPIRPGAKAA
ncbi:MAG: DUF599 domain-containing protein [Actinomycetota bacterium]